MRTAINGSRAPTCSGASSTTAAERRSHHPYRRPGAVAQGVRADAHGSRGLGQSDDRPYAPATLRDRDFILDVLRDVLPMTGVVLEIASGSGEHIVHFARNFPALVFQPSNPEFGALLSVAAWVKATRVTNVRAHFPGRFAIILADRFRLMGSFCHQHGPYPTLGGHAGIDQGGRRDTSSLPLSLCPYTRSSPSIRLEPSRSQPGLGSARP